MDTIYELPTWAETILIICVAIMLAGLAAWLVCKTIQEAIEAESKLEHKRRRSETKAINNWQSLYEEEKSKHINDVADLISKIQDERYLNAENMKEADRQIKDLLRQIKEKDALLKLAKVKDL